MNLERAASHLQRLKPTLALFLLFTTLPLLLTAQATPQSQQDNTTSAQEEREFKSTIPEHVPIKVKVKNEKSFKDMKNKEWARDLEIEVKNTGSKPIYYLYVIIVMPEILIDGNPAAFLTAYGRKELAFLETPIEEEDVPILPGESITLKVRESQVRAYEKWRDAEKGVEPKKIEFDLQRINFGDGTGIRGSEGKHFSVKRQSSNIPRPKGIGSRCTPAPKAREADTSIKFLKTVDHLMPARNWRAFFYHLKFLRIQI